MLDIKLFRENADIIRESEKRRFRKPANVDKVIKLDEQWRNLKREIDELKKMRNQFSAEIGKMKKKDKKADISDIQKKVQEIKEKIEKKEKKSEETLKNRDDVRYSIGNILHDTVPIGKTDADDAVIRTWGEQPSFNFSPRGHADLVEYLDVAEVTKAAEVSGSRTYYLKNELVFLNFALAQFAMDFLTRERNFTPFWTPYFLRQEVMKGAAELGDFRETLYNDPKEDIFFIATSEQTLAALHWNEILETDRLPLRYAGFSSCFRREAGSHGKDTKGIFRVHQFDKIEQFVFCKPEESWDIHEELIQNAEALFQKLEIPHRIVSIASGELNDNAAKKYDVEAWFPAQEAYRETVSCSNCTDYQARKLNIRVGRAGAEKSFLHTLNSTAIATERAICAILENNQEEDGAVKLPKALHPFLGGRTEITPKSIA
ncbi:MAG: serine--tRNA ligase [Candidatus Hodarchaeales archaeon]|jgi:seryl-tRNA synthetase